MLRGAWAGVFLVLSGAILLAIPTALYVTGYLCRKLYGTEPPTDTTPSSDRMDAPTDAHLKRCPFCRVIQAWLSATIRGTYLPFWELIGMRNRGTPPDIVVHAYLMVKRSSAHISIAELEDIYITESKKVHDAFDLVNIVTGTKD